MTGELVTQVVAASSPVMVVVFTWLTKRRIDNRAAEETSINARLANQRADFQALIDPLQATVTTLYARVESLDTRVVQAESDVLVLTGAMRDTLEHLEDNYNDPGPVLPERVTHLIGGGA